ncbi:hypothetical protein HOY80DRAFT_948377 [Tuber brumale]|nr:hypothetical protein HOY80DRAFT_948377 [Tuber brumale]
MAQVYSHGPSSLHSVFSVLNAHDHPFIMVGKYALRWMGVPVYTGYTIDILVRTTQLSNIHRAFVQTKEWLEVDESGIEEHDLEFHCIEHRLSRKLKRYNEDWFIRLCDEDSYCLAVDTQKTQVPHVLNYNCALVESEFHPNGSGRPGRVRPFLLTDNNIKFVGDPAITFPVFIPTIPQFVDSCLGCIRGRDFNKDQSCILPQIDLDNLERYLVLDSPSQRDKLLAKVTDCKRLTEYFTKREEDQERRMKRVMQRRAKRQVDATSSLEVPFFMPLP